MNRRRILVLLVLVAVIVPTVAFLPVRELLTQFLAVVEGLGPVGAALLALAYIPAAVFFFPGSILTLGAGFAFGLLVGTVAVSIGATLGASAAFMVGRTLARDWVKSKVEGTARFRALDEAVGREGFKIVLLTRLSPVFPFTLLNYAYGVTRVSFWDHFFASWIGMLPGTLMYVYLGSGLKSLAEVAAGSAESGAGQQIFFFAGLVVTVIVTVFVTRLARRALQEQAGVPVDETPATEGGIRE